jgi:phosphoserine phosphatase
MKMNGNFKHSGLILVSGVDSPGITSKLFEALAPFQLQILDFEQVVIRDRLLLTVLIALDPAHEKAVEEDLISAFANTEIDIALDFAERISDFELDSNLHLVVLAKEINPNSISEIAKKIAEYKGNIDRVRRTASFPITALEFDITASITESQLKNLQSELAKISAHTGVDIAIQRGGLTRRAKRVVLLDMDSTLIREEVIDLLATKIGSGEEVAAITESAMRGEIDFVTSLNKRVSTLTNAPDSIFKEVASEINLTPGARTLINTLHKLGHKVGVVSGGFINVIEPILKELKIDFYRANSLEVIDGKLTGKLIGPVIDREAKAEALREFAKLENVDLSQTIAIGDGANDLGMIEIAGLGIAFNAKPKVRETADASINTPYLDSVLYLMGITRDEVEEKL